VEEALQCLDATDFSFVILDLRLGCQDGLELVKAMRSNPLFASIPAIALTGMHGQTARAYETGVNALIFKSSDFSQFSTKVTSLVNFWASVAELPDATRQRIKW
jgi:two-component system, response regulator